MAKVFTITEGLENMGALKTGGQGSVYKGKRIGEIITAIKILPTPIHSETADDKNFTSFQNEVQKLKKVNEHPNPNVVTIISSGITESGNFPFIEMEYIEGPDLEELLKPPHDPVFTIKDVIKVAEELSNALAHCHSADVKHGDIKSNNVKFNIKTNNYILLDFGLSVMSDEQRRTSFRNAGAIEFMAPEQNEGRMLFQTDVYSFGVIIFELLAGIVPFPLKEKGEMGRNTVMLAHMEKPAPDLLPVRRQSLPALWSNGKKEQEMQVPEWLLNMVYICLEKKPEHRFATGMMLHDYVLRNSIVKAGKSEGNDEQLTILQKENKRLLKENERLEKELAGYHQQWTGVGDNKGTAPEVKQASKELITPPVPLQNAKKQKTSIKTAFAIILPLIALGVLIYVFIKYNVFQQPAKNFPAESIKVSKLPETPRTEEITAQLKDASAYLKSNNIERALYIYKTLAKKEVPEAMFEYANLALQNNNPDIDCTEAISLLTKASDKDYTSAKTTLGFLLSFADDADFLQQNGYGHCNFRKDLSKGSKLLMEAMLQGDTTASLLLDELNVKEPK